MYGSPSVIQNIPLALPLSHRDTLPPSDQTDPYSKLWSFKVGQNCQVHLIFNKMTLSRMLHCDACKPLTRPDWDFSVKRFFWAKVQVFIENFDFTASWFSARKQFRRIFFVAVFVVVLLRIGMFHFVEINSNHLKLSLIIYRTVFLCQSKAL